MRRPRIPLAPLFALGAALAAGGGPRVAPEPPPVGTRAAGVALDGQERVERFLVEWAGAGLPPAGAPGLPEALEEARLRGEVGLVELRRRRVDGGWQLEQDIAFPFEGVRVMAVECLSAVSPRLVWREVTPRGGRTLFAEWRERSEALRVVEWGLDGSLRESHETGRGAVMPQYLVELARAGHLDGGTFRVFDPLAGGLERWTLTQRYLTAGDGGAPGGPELLREIELRREDGSLAGRYRLRGDELLELAWQEGGLRVSPLDEEGYRRRRREWGLDPAGGPEPATPTVREP